MQPGDRVMVKVFGGRTVNRIVVQPLGNTVVICRPDEWREAVRENRQPNGVGFPLSDVRQMRQIKKERA